ILGDAVAVRGQQVVCGRTGRSVDLADVKDVVVLLQPVFFLIGLDQGRRGTLEALTDDSVGKFLEARIRGPPRGQFYEFVPITGEGEFENQADYSVVEILNFTRK